MRATIQKAYEFGGNEETGYYKKYTDGTMECFGNRYIDLKSTIEWKTVFFYEYNLIKWNFPKPFINNPTLQFYVYNRNFFTATVNDFDITSIKSIICYSGQMYDEKKYLCSYYAIGRWK